MSEPVQAMNGLGGLGTGEEEAGRPSSRKISKER